MADNKIMEEIFKTIDIITSHKLYQTEYLYTEDCVIVASTDDPYTYRILHENEEYDAQAPFGEVYQPGQSVVVLFTDYSRISKKIILYSTITAQYKSLNTSLYIGGNLGVGASTTNYTLTVGGTVAPGTDNLYSLGSAAARWSQVYAGTGSINTSDLNDKQDIEELSNIEKNVALAIKQSIKKFKFKDSVVKKGDLARIHVGVIAQEVSSIFQSYGLDPSHYALFCEDVWYEKNGKILKEFEAGAVEKRQLGIRYDELYAFIISSL